MFVQLEQILILFLLCGLCSTSRTRPNIVLIVADDLGYNDVSWHNPDILSPNLAELTHRGVILEQGYVQPICTPTRSALMTGRYPIHTGRQHRVLLPQEPHGLYANLTLLPEHLANLGYSTHMVGKWHLGFCNRAYLPTRRGFDSFNGFYLGSEDYYGHTRAASTSPSQKGYDFRINEEVDSDSSGVYSAHVFAEKSAKIISRHNQSRPLFLYLAFQSVHAPLQVPSEYEKPFQHIKNMARRTFSGMMLALDEAVGNVTRALSAAGMADNTIIAFTGDNGGQTFNGGNNFPLRGNKNTLWEGGTRVPVFVSGAMLKNRGESLEGLFHVTDWLPTLIAAAGGNPRNLRDLDGVNQWPMLAEGKPSARRELLYNIDPMKDPGSGEGPSGAVRVGKYKLIKGNPGQPDGWIPPHAVLDLASPGSFSRYSSLGKVFRGRQAPGDKMLRLFDLEADPYEKRDISGEARDVVRRLEIKLGEYLLTMVEPDIGQEVPRGNPAYFEGAWSTGWCLARP